jgi:hypothetical protein
MFCNILTLQLLCRRLLLLCSFLPLLQVAVLLVVLALRGVTGAAGRLTARQVR